MENNQLLPFERNRYYVGKLLTSADFQAEQTYNNHKRRFLNEMMFGSGIVCGLGVYSLDDLSVMVDSGVAVDGCGREVAVESPVVRKLSAVEGFEDLKTERATLCLQYREEDVHPVYTVRGQESGESYECNRVREGWQLVLRDSRSLPPVCPPEPEFLATAVLYEDEDYAVVCAMPAQNPCGASVRLEITVRRLRETAEPLTLKAAVQTPAFTDENGSHEMLLELLDLCPEGETVLTRYLRAQSVPAPESVLMADNQSIQVRVAVSLPGGGEENKLQKLSGKSIAAIQPTVVLATRESHFFNVRFNNMEPCTLTYELTEKDSGEITSDGIYTAPGREGVFEIHISCAELPLISTYAYAVVKKRDVQEDEKV